MHRVPQHSARFLVIAVDIIACFASPVVETVVEELLHHVVVGMELSFFGRFEGGLEPQEVSRGEFDGFGGGGGYEASSR